LAAGSGETGIADAPVNAGCFAMVAIRVGVTVMGSRFDENDSWDDSYDDADLDSLDADDDDETIKCPYCGKSIHEDSPRCPYCEQYLSDEDAPAAAKPWWIVLGVMVCLLIMLSWLWAR
jgi:uncharacterized paraquat-inducible protein A